MKNNRGKAPPKRTARLAEEAFERLRKAILSGEFREGDAVKEIRLVREWKVGRTPLREAIRRAAEFGYLVLRPNQAPLVRKLTAEDIVQIYSLRALLECFALELAWDRLATGDLHRLEKLAKKAQSSKSRQAAQFQFDAELHQLWIQKSGNPWLVAILERLLIYRPRYGASHCILDDRTDLTDEAFAEHQKILQALKKRDLATTRRRLRSHIEHGGQTLEALHRQKTAKRAGPAAAGIPRRGSRGSRAACRLRFQSR